MRGEIVGEGGGKEGGWRGGVERLEDRRFVYHTTPTTPTTPHRPHHTYHTYHTDHTTPHRPRHTYHATPHHTTPTTPHQAESTETPRGGAWTLVGRVLQEEGPRGFYRGALPVFARAFPANAVPYISLP